MNVLMFCDYFLPGFKAGGPIKTISNLIVALKDFNFTLVTSDHDINEVFPYGENEIKEVVSNFKYNADIIYLSKKWLRYFFGIFRVLKRDFDCIYFNSFFSLRYSIIPLFVFIIFRLKTKIVISPKGEFSEAAINIKPVRKRIYINLFKFISLFHDFTFHASSDLEAVDIRRVIGEKVSIKEAMDISIVPELKIESSSKEEDSLRVIFYSRIVPIKNLDFVIKVISLVKSKVILDVYGPIEDENYWGNCLEMVSNLPDNVSFSYKGIVNPLDTYEVMKKYDLFFLPSKGENYGHVVAEALSSGLPVLISDRTPWRNLSENKVGWDISLEDIQCFCKVIDDLSIISNEKYLEWRLSIRDWAIVNISSNDVLENNMRVFKA